MPRAAESLEVLIMPRVAESSKVLIVQPKEIGNAHPFVRKTVRPDPWYGLAARRLARRWSKDRGQVYVGPFVTIERRPDLKCWWIFVSCEVATVPGWEPGARILPE